MPEESTLDGALLESAFCAGMGLICKRGQEAIDLVIPMLLPDEEDKYVLGDAGRNMSGVFVQVKNHAAKQSVPKLRTICGQVAALLVEQRLNDRPYVLLIMVSGRDVTADLAHTSLLYPLSLYPVPRGDPSFESLFRQQTSPASVALLHNHDDSLGLHVALNGLLASEPSNAGAGPAQIFGAPLSPLRELANTDYTASRLQSMPLLQRPSLKPMAHKFDNCQEHLSRMDTRMDHTGREDFLGITE